MRIGIDARFLTHPQRGGFKTYTQNLINAISRVDQDNQYFIYVDRSFDPGELPSPGNFTYRVLDGTLPFFGMIFREQGLLPYHVSADNIDLLHSLCNTAPVIGRAKRVVTLHDTIQVSSALKPGRLADLKPWAIMTYSKWSILQALHYTDLIITVSEFEKKGISDSLGIPGERIAVTHLAPNPVFKPASAEEKDEFRGKVLEKFGSREGFILSVGFEDRKNIPLVIEAYRCLSTEMPDLRLVIVSAGEKRRLLFQEMVHSYSLDDRVTVLGSMAPSDLTALYNLAGVFVFPSERESFGLPPLEAISCGTPTIAMNGSSLPEILGDGALLIDGKDVQKWADAIRRVLTDKSIRADMIERGLHRAAEMSWDTCARETIRIYKHVFENNHTSRPPRLKSGRV